MGSDSQSECPECGPVTSVVRSAGLLECPNCGWEDQSSGFSSQRPTSKAGSNPGHAPLSIGRRSRVGLNTNWCGSTLSSSERARAARLRRTQRHEDRIFRAETCDPMVERVKLVLRSHLLRDHDHGSANRVVERAVLRLKDLRKAEGKQSDARLFRTGCQFGPEAAAICLMELIDREGGIAPPDTKRRKKRISVAISLDKMGDKRLDRAVMKTRRAIKALLPPIHARFGSQGVYWGAPVVPTERFDMDLILPHLSTIVERKISQNEFLRFSDKPLLMRHCRIMISQPGELGLDGAMLRTIVEIATLLCLEARESGGTKLTPGELGVSSTALNHLKSVREAVSASRVSVGRDE